MRSLIYSLALAIVASTLAADATNAATGNENRAQQIANDLKLSGQLKGYRVGVKFEDGVAWLNGTVTSARQRELAEAVASSSEGVTHVINKLTVEPPRNTAGRRGGQNVGLASNMRGPNRQRRAAGNNMPVPYARSGGGVQPVAYGRQAQYHHRGTGPAPMAGGAPAAAGQSVSYDNPQMPGYAWPSYAASPNYAALTYPKQYSPSAWPYIGPFYPYPQVPLGWRKVTLEWDDGWWFLDFKDCKHCK